MPIYAQSSTIRSLLIPLVDIDQTTVANEDVLQYNSTTGKFENQPLSSGGISLITTASNVGTGDNIFKQKTLQNLEFKSITAGAGITLTANADDIQITATGATDTASNLGGGEQVFSTKVGGNFQFRSLNEGTGNINLTVSTNADEIEFTNTAEINTASNVGDYGSEGLFSQKNAYDLEFKSLAAGNNITINSSPTTVTITAQDDPATSYSYQFGLTFDGNGDVDTITSIPGSWTITRIGNIITVQHPINRYPKSISYWGKDSVNGWQYRIPTAGYQATLDAGDELNEFKIDITATIAGADASSEAKVNVIF